jgi:catecholate siderophore receptor
MKNRTFSRDSRPRRRRRGTARLFVLGSAFVAASALSDPLATPAFAQRTSQDRAAANAGTSAPGAGGAADQVQQARRFDIPAGTIESVAEQFTNLTGIRVALANDQIRDLPSPGVAGVMTPEQALAQMLAGTSVGFAVTARDLVTLDVRTSEFVEVSGGATTLESPKYTQALRDIPQTISVISKDVMQAQGATSLRDVLRNVPGITFQAGEGGGGLPGDNLTMRGFSAGNDMFVDGVRDPGGYGRDTFNLEQVEVAKGPSSSIAGRGATGGAINQVTKSPGMTEGYSGSIGFGNAEYGRGTLDVNRPIGDPSLGAAFRLNVMWTDTGVPGRDVVENAGWGVAPSLAFGLGKPTEVMLKYSHLTQANVPDYGLPWGASAGFPTGAFQATPPVDQSNFYGLSHYDFEDILSDVATAQISHRFNGQFTLRNITRYSETDRDSAITAPRPPNRQLQRRTMGNENIANQTNLTASFGTRARHDLVTGVEFSRETTSNRNSSQTANQPQISILAPNPDDSPLGPMPANSGNPSKTLLDQTGVYLFDTLNLGSRWQLTGGARWDSVDVDYSLTTLATGVVTEIESSDSMVSWRGGVVYKPRSFGSVYAGYGTSFNPSVDAAATGAALSTAANAANNPNLAPEETRTYEVGTKWDLLRNRLSVTGAVFHTEKINARTRNANNDPFVMTGRQQVRGVEVGATGSLTERWTLLGSYAFMDSAIRASANSAELGNDLALTPEATFNLWTTFALPWDITVGGGAQYMDAVFRNTTNTLTVPSYWLANALVTYSVNQHLTFRLNGQNLADAQYVDRVGGGHYIPGPRRQVILNADVGF